MANTPQNTSSSFSKVFSTLGPVLAYSFGFFVLFCIVRRLLPKVYSPRTILGRPQERTPGLPDGYVNWLSKFFGTRDKVVLNTHTLDGYMFLRLLRISVATCIVGCLITWPILLPVNITGAGEQKQLNLLTFSNVASPSHPESYKRYYAHVVCAYIFFGFIIYMITRESIYYINVRQAYLVSPLYANRISSRTVLFCSVPDEYLNEAVLRRLLGESVRNIWIHRHISTLVNKVKERDEVAMKLEKAEIQLIQNVNTARRKALKKGNRQGEELMTLKNGVRSQIKVSDTPSNSSDHKGSIDEQWLDSKKRPTHRLSFLIGRKVDTIDWSRKELTRLIPEVEALQREHREGKGKPHNSVFVEFETLRDAQSAFQSLTHHKMSRMAPRFTGISPEEIIWRNLRTKWIERIARYIISTTFVAGLVVLYIFPVAAISSITDVTALRTVSYLSWLSFLDKLPKALIGLVSGLLPALLLLIITALMPPVLRLLAYLGGEPTRSAVEYTVQNWYFWYQVIQVFLVTTLAGGAWNAVVQIAQQPEYVINVLAASLPTASNFYLSYIIVQGLGVVASTLLSPLPLVSFVLLGRLLDKTPRQKWERWTSLSDPGLGTVYPIYTNLLIIAISYSCIAPLVLGFAAIGLYLFYLAYRYEFLYVYNVPYDTKGLMYARALQQIFVGLYLAELCLIGLFSISLGESTIVVGPFALMIILLVFTAIYHFSLNQKLRPLLRYLPKTLETEEQRLLALESAEAGEDEYPEYRGAEAQVDSIISRPSFDYSSTAKSAKPREQEKPNFFMKWLRPDIYADYYTLRRQVPRDFANIVYDESTEAGSYFHPAITSSPPKLWIPRDEAGVSHEECMQTSKVIPISDEGAVLDAKGKIVWDRELATEVPIATEKVYW